MSDYKSKLIEREGKIRDTMHLLWGSAKEKRYDKRRWAEFQNELSAYFGEVKRILANGK